MPNIEKILIPGQQTPHDVIRPNAGTSIDKLNSAIQDQGIGYTEGGNVTTIEWAGDREGRTYFSYIGGDAPFYWYKVSNSIISTTDIVGGKMFISVGGETYGPYDISQDDIVIEPNGKGFYFGEMFYILVCSQAGDYVLVEGEEGQDPIIVNIPETGIYYVYIPFSEEEIYYTTKLQYGNFGTVHTILPKFINADDASENQVLKYYYNDTEGDHVGWDYVNEFSPSNTGYTGQLLTKTSSGYNWQNAPKELPDTGYIGQYLKKTSDGPQWATVDALPAGASNGQFLRYYNNSHIWADVNQVPSGGEPDWVLKKDGYDDSYKWEAVSEVPSGGAANQVLRKQSEGYAWADAHEIPVGGTQNQVLRKNSSTNYDASWSATREVPTASVAGKVLTTTDTSGNYAWQDLNIPEDPTLTSAKSIKGIGYYGLTDFRIYYAGSTTGKTQLTLETLPFYNIAEPPTQYTFNSTDLWVVYNGFSITGTKGTENEYGFVVYDNKSGVLDTKPCKVRVIVCWKTGGNIPYAYNSETRYVQPPEPGVYFMKHTASGSYVNAFQGQATALNRIDITKTNLTAGTGIDINGTTGVISTSAYIKPETGIPSSDMASDVQTSLSNADTALSGVNTINGLIPQAATTGNQLADKNFVNSSIATQTGTFRGTFNVVDDLHLTTSATHAQIAAALATAVPSASNNDYAFVGFPNATVTTQFDKYERYKYSTNTWVYEYTLNNSSFTAAQWAAINSGITATNAGILASAIDIAGIAYKTQSGDPPIVLTWDGSTTGRESGEIQDDESETVGHLYKISSDQFLLNDLIGATYEASDSSTGTLVTTNIETISDDFSIITKAAISSGANAIIFTCDSNYVYSDDTYYYNFPSAGTYFAIWNDAPTRISKLTVPSKATIKWDGSTTGRDHFQFERIWEEEEEEWTYYYHYYKVSDIVPLSTEIGNNYYILDATEGYGDMVIVASQHVTNETDVAYTIGNYDALAIVAKKAGSYTITKYDGGKTVNIPSAGVYFMSTDYEDEPTKTIVLGDTRSNRVEVLNKIDISNTTLTAGSNVAISSAGVISAIDTTYTAGTGIDITDGVISNTQSGAIWGNITGTLSNQGDLNTALGGKQPIIDTTHKLSADLVDDASATNKFVTSTEKTSISTAIQPNDNISQLTNDAGYITSAAITGKEDTSNKVTTISSSSTDTQYPSAKLVYDQLATKYEKPVSGIPSSDLAASADMIKLASAIQNQGIAYSTSISIPWDGDTTGRTYFVGTTGGTVSFNYYKVSELSPSYSDLSNGTFTVYSNGTQVQASISNQPYYSTDSVCCVFPTNSGFPIFISCKTPGYYELTDGTNITTCTILEAGIYYNFMSAIAYTSNLTYNITSKINIANTNLTAGDGIAISNAGVISNTRTSAQWGNITGTLSNQTDLYPKLVPTCTSADNGKFLTVVNGSAAWTTVANAHGESF